MFCKPEISSEVREAAKVNVGLMKAYMEKFVQTYQVCGEYTNYGLVIEPKITFRKQFIDIDSLLQK